MAQTKVKLISDGVIDVGHLASGHGITTDNIGEGSNLYYTDARVSTYLSTNSYATEGYVTTAVSNLVAAAPSTLDTLNELAAALGDDPNFATTVTNSIATKLPLAGGTLTGALSAPDFYATYGTGGYVSMRAGGASAAGYLEVFKPGAVRLGYIGYDTTNILYQSENNANHVFQGSNVGIGTSSPTSAGGYAKTLQVSDASSASISLSRTSATASSIEIGTFSGSNLIDSIGSGIPLRFKVDGSERMRITSAGNVGIGTTSPSTKLHVADSVIIDSDLYVGGTSSLRYPPSDRFIALQSSTDGATVGYNMLVNDGVNYRRGSLFMDDSAGLWGLDYTYSSGSLDFVVRSAGGELMRVRSDGKVGIGESSPSAKLQTSNGGYILSGGWGLFSSYTSDGLFSTNARPNFLSTNGGGGTYSKFSGQGGLVLGYQDNGSGLYSPAYGFEVKSTDGIPVGGRVVKAIVMRDVDTGVEPFWINNNGSAFFNDSISIGRTSALGGSFHVYGNTGVFQSPTNGSSVIDGNTYSLLLGPKENRNPTANTYYGGIAFNHLLNYNGGTGYNANSHAWIGLRLYDTPASERSNLVFATKEGTGTTTSDVPIERMTINPFGMVGIGTSNPSQISSGVPTLTINSPNSNTLSGGVIYQANGSSQAYHYWENNFLVHQVQGTGAHKFAQGASTKFAVYSEGVDIIPGLEYSQQYTYSSSWASSFQQVVPNGTLDGTRVYLFTIWTNSFGVAPYYAAASAILTTAQSTNDNSAGPAIDLLTAHHVGSGSKWQIKMSSGGSSTNGVQVMLAGGPSVSSIPVFVRVTMLSNF